MKYDKWVWCGCLTYVQAFDTAASQFGVPKVLEVADMVLRKVPDRLSVMTYLFQLRAYFTREQECGDADAEDSSDIALNVDSDADTQQSADITSTDDHQPPRVPSVSKGSI